MGAGPGGERANGSAAGAGPRLALAGRRAKARGAELRSALPRRAAARSRRGGRRRVRVCQPLPAPASPGTMSGRSRAVLSVLLLLLGAPGVAQAAGDASCRPVRAAFQVLQPGAKWVPESPVPGEVPPPAARGVPDRWCPLRPSWGCTASGLDGAGGCCLPARVGSGRAGGMRGAPSGTSRQRGAELPRVPCGCRLRACITCGAAGNRASLLLGDGSEIPEFSAFLVTGGCQHPQGCASGAGGSR